MLEQQRAYWNHSNTKVLIDLYGEYRKNVGHSLKTLKTMWQVIARDLNAQTSSDFTAEHCENKWRTLTRAYKLFNDNKKVPKRGRFEFQDEMDVIYQDPDVNPLLLLSCEVVDDSTTIEEEPECVKILPNVENEGRVNVKQSVHNTESFGLKKRATILEKIRADRANYYKRKLQLDAEKLEQMKRRNQLLKERNDILKRSISSSSCSSLALQPKSGS